MTHVKLLLLHRNTLNLLNDCKQMINSKKNYSELDRNTRNHSTVCINKKLRLV